MRGELPVVDAHADFASYARARWSALVRSLTLQGVAPDDARHAATVALARCEPDWDDLRERHDLDLVVWGEAFEAAALPVDDTALEGLLDGEGWRAVDDDGSSVDLVEVRWEVRVQERRRRRLVTRGLAATAVVLAVVVGTAWAVTGPGPVPELGRLAVDERPNALGLVWRSGDRVHLAQGVVVLPDAEQVVGALGGAVYGDASGRVVVLESDGDRRVVGHQEPGAALVSWAARGVVAWVDPRAAADVLRVHDVRARRAVAALEVPPGTEPVALADAELLFRTPGASWSWRLPDGEPTRVPGPLATAYSGDGRLAVTHVRDGPAGARAGRLVVVNRETGAEVASGVAPTAEVLDLAFAPDSSLVYLTRPATASIGAGEYHRLTDGGLVVASRCQVDADVFAGRLHGTQCVRLDAAPQDVDPPDLVG